MSLKLRFELRFNGPILLDGFLPDTTDKGLPFQLRQGRYNATLYMSNRQQQLDHVFDCSGLTLELENTEADPEVVAALEEGTITEKTETFGRELFEVVAGIHTRIVDYFRNIGKQSWVDPLFPELSGYPKAVEFSSKLSSPQMFMNSWGACWQDSSGNWRFLKLGKQIHRAAGELKEGLSRDAWEQLGVSSSEANEHQCDKFSSLIAFNMRVRRMDVSPLSKL